MCFSKCLQALNGIQHIIEMLKVIFCLSVYLWNNALTLLKSLVLNGLVNLLLQTDPSAKANTFPGQYQIPSGSSHG